MKNISIFCGAHEGKNPEHAKAAKSVAELIAKKGINVVFGGGNVGLMKVISSRECVMRWHRYLFGPLAKEIYFLSTV